MFFGNTSSKLFQLVDLKPLLFNEVESRKTLLLEITNF